MNAELVRDPYDMTETGLVPDPNDVFAHDTNDTQEVGLVCWIDPNNSCNSGISVVKCLVGLTKSTDMLRCMHSMKCDAFHYKVAAVLMETARNVLHT